MEPIPVKHIQEARRLEALNHWETSWEPEQDLRRKEEGDQSVPLRAATHLICGEYSGSVRAATHMSDLGSLTI